MWKQQHEFYGGVMQFIVLLVAAQIFQPMILCKLMIAYDKFYKDITIKLLLI